jgi:hypothetical protein
MPGRATDTAEEDVAPGGHSDADIETPAQRAPDDAAPLAKNAYKVAIASNLLRRGIARLVAQ